MYLSVLDHGHRRRARAFMAATGAVSRTDAADVVRTLLYRPGFFGGPMTDLTANVMRGPSAWSTGEREFLAHEVASLHRCAYCEQTHGRLTEIASAGALHAGQAGLISEALRAVRPVVRAASLGDGSGADPLEAARAQGVADQGIRDALRVALVWNVVNRLAHAFGYELRDGQLDAGTKALHRFGYRFPGVLLADGPEPPPSVYADALDEVEAAIGRLRWAVYEGPAHTSTDERAAAARGDHTEPVVRDFLTRVRDRPETIAADDVLELRGRGESEDTIFELSTAAALGISYERYAALTDTLLGHSEAGA